MKKQVRLGWPGRLALLAAFGLLLGACVSEDLNDRVLGPGGAENVFNFTLSSGAGFGLPAGRYTVPKSPTDAWGRAGRTKIFNTQNAFAILSYSLNLSLRNAKQDPRLPRLADDDAAVGGYGYHLQPWALGANGWWDFWTEFTKLKPNTTYTVMFVRYGLKVNGTLDAADVLRGRAVTSPDELVVLGGTPRGTPNYVCEFSFDGYPVVQIDANPFVLGYFTTDGTGTGVGDCVVSAHGKKWWNNAASAFPPGAIDSLPIAANDVRAFSLPTYNYIVVVEGKGTDASPVPTGPHALRFQVGHDLDLNGNPLPNALAPFPTQKQLLVETTFEFTGASKLASGNQYRFWAYNSADASKSVPLVGNWRLVNEDGVAIDSASKVSGIPGRGGPRDPNLVTVSSDTWDGDLFDYDRIRITIDAANATRPGNVVVLDARFVDAVGKLETLRRSGAFTFGGGYAYTGEGRGHFYGDDFRLALRGLSRPPAGYFYEVWLVNAATGQAASLGELKGPYPEYPSLKDADTNASLAPGGLIPDAAIVVNRTNVGVDYKAFTHVYVTLSPKLRDGLPVQVALQGEIPGQVLGK
ncbi:MAG: hypothetical protein HY704_14190 [Gemmatimonadetes bacterium]|nr:hypothetical protein [Gemmatimonadota bacterium]